MLQVRHGQRDQGWVEITEGLAEGTPVVSEGVIKIRDGSPVTTELPTGRPSGPVRGNAPAASES
jgi:hypothetical protein